MDLLDAHHRLVDLVAEGVGRSDQRHLVPGDQAEVATVPSLEDDRALAVDPPARDHQVHPLGRAKLRAGDGPIQPPHPLDRGAGGVDDHLRPDRAARAALLVAHPRADDPTLVSAQELEDFGVVDRLAAEAASADQRLQHQPRVVHLAVVEESGSPQPVAPQVLGVVADLIWPQHSEARRAAEARQTPVGEEGGANLPEGRPAVLEDRPQEGNRAHQVRVQTEQEIPLPTGLPGQAELALRDVAKPAVNQLGGAARGSGGEVTALDEQRSEPAGGRVPENARAGDAAADDQQVDALALGPPESARSLANRPVERRHDRTPEPAGRFACSASAPRSCPAELRTASPRRAGAARVCGPTPPSASRRSISPTIAGSL